MYRRLIICAAAIMMIASVGCIGGAAAKDSTSPLSITVQPGKNPAGSKWYKVVWILNYKGSLPSGGAFISFNVTREWIPGFAKPAMVTAPPGAVIRYDSQGNSTVHFTGFGATRKLVVTAIYAMKSVPRACVYGEAILDVNPVATEVTTPDPAFCNYKSSI